MSDEPATPRSPTAHHLRVQRTARYYLLGGSTAAGHAARGSAAQSVRTIWFVLHGYGQLAGEFIRYFADLADDRTLVVAPEALNRFYLSAPENTSARDRAVGATWMTREDRASDIADYVELLDALYDDVAADAARSGVAVNVLGFSQGAATATRWVTHGRSPIARLVLWGGLVPPDTDLTRGHGALRDVPLTIVMGRRDHYVDGAALAAEEARLTSAGIRYELIQFDGGHAITRAVFPRLRGDGAAASGGSVSGASDR
ncbi:MAG: alpha/beta hydrolase [Gemmatimonadales bacterium]